MSGKKDGRSKTRTYKCWAYMKTRCLSPGNKDYWKYGGRGIMVCSRWLSSFYSFVEDMGECPSPMHSIDRINNDGNYESGNCRWATPKEQASNRRNNRIINVRGESHTIEDWA